VTYADAVLHAGHWHRIDDWPARCMRHGAVVRIQSKLV